ncbi:methylated-DNA--[protein]-cysteine S-methyltransferase [Microbacterium bovistercoris]|uniref:Methylated-DNA--protein-cysteine methyltransferase n=1 Tax=Microbacterium bovistercoris TaxID=2293570 RepID=A0A371NT92_9MICO|nr:methylated-DNA--[protein]-cysteine S-methyltransferase [Microbacterium bovistercoris]REJ04990.1 methylated-DNA--[protein]-cysteine S-methyltransferase [Microbacterium bovistercoris]
MTSFGLLESPVGVIGIESDGTAITRVTWTTSIPASGADTVLSAALEQLGAYFSGDLTTFDVPIDLGRQTPVTRAVLETLYETVGHGESITYGELAARSGTEVPARAIGSIMGANPIPLIVPCHRVVAGDGLGGYSGGAPGEGLATKRWLLEHEGVLPRSLF